MRQPFVESQHAVTVRFQGAPRRRRPACCVAADTDDSPPIAPSPHRPTRAANSCRSSNFLLGFPAADRDGGSNKGIERRERGGPGDLLEGAGSWRSAVKGGRPLYTHTLSRKERERERAPSTAADDADGPLSRQPQLLKENKFATQPFNRPLFHYTPEPFLILAQQSRKYMGKELIARERRTFGRNIRRNCGGRIDQFRSHGFFPSSATGPAGGPSSEIIAIEACQCGAYVCENVFPSSNVLCACVSLRLLRWCRCPSSGGLSGASLSVPLCSLALIGVGCFRVRV